MLGVIAALGAGDRAGDPGGRSIGHKANGDLTTFGNVVVQMATALGFLLVPMAIAARAGRRTAREILGGSGCGASSPRR